MKIRFELLTKGIKVYLNGEWIPCVDRIEGELPNPEWKKDLRPYYMEYEGEVTVRQNEDGTKTLEIRDAKSRGNNEDNQDK